MRFTGMPKAALIVLLLFAMSFAAGSQASAGNAGARNQNTATIQQQPRKTSPPYTGDLSVFDYPDRDQKLQVERVMDVLAIKPGKTVADIGAGSGWFTVRAARRVTSTGRVWAVDINPAAIRYINRRLRRDGLSNVHTIVSKADDPLLPANSIDAVLLLKTYRKSQRKYRVDGLDLWVLGSPGGGRQFCDALDRNPGEAGKDSSQVVACR